MKTMQMLALGSAVAGASAKHQGRYHNTTTAATPNVVYTTEIVTALTTYCPGPTTITHGAKTYTVTSATTLTITDCPCTISKPVHPTGTPGDECSKQCYRAYDACRGKPGANMSYCAYEFASCLGYNPFGGDGSLITPTACSKTAASTQAPTQTATSDDCAKNCYNAYNKCRGAPGANFAVCGSQFASCLGYNPFTGRNGSLVTPTACSKTAASTQAPTQTATSDDCAKNCYNAYNACRGAPGANFAVCGSQFASCLGYNPFTGRNGTLVTPTACSGKPLVSSTAVSTPCPTETHVQPPQDCAKMCYDKYNMCRGKPGANMSFCASEFAGCLGYNPFKNGTLVTPTACSKPAASSTAVPTNPVVPTQSLPAEKDCAKMCYDKYNMCRGKPGANMSFCASQFAGCLGYNPFDGNGSLVTPTACSSGTAVTAATATETATDTATGVVTEPTSAMTEPTSAVTEPTSAVTEPTSAVTEPTSAVTEPTSAVTEPTGAGTQATGNPTGTNPPVTAGAGALAPAKILLALGAIALL